MSRTVEECPRPTAWYHVGIGSVMALLVASLEFRNGSMLIAAAMGLLLVMLTVFRKQAGRWSQVYSGKDEGTRKLVIAGVAALLAMIVLGLVFKLAFGVDGAMIVSAVIVGLGASWFGIKLDRVTQS